MSNYLEALGKLHNRTCWSIKDQGGNTLNAIWNGMSPYCQVWDCHKDERVDEVWSYPNEDGSVHWFHQQDLVSAGYELIERVY